METKLIEELNDLITNIISPLEKSLNVKIYSIPMRAKLEAFFSQAISDNERKVKDEIIEWAEENKREFPGTYADCVFYDDLVDHLK